MTTERLSVQKLPKNRVEATLRIDEAEYSAAEAKALQHLAENVQVKGFRPGHAPADMVRSKVSPDQLFEEAVRMILRDSMEGMVTEHKIMPVIPPKVEVQSRMPVVIKVTFVERPDVTLKNPDSLKAEKREVEINQKDVDRVMASVLQDHKTVTPVDRAAQDGDQVVMDFHATDESNVEIAGLKAEGYAATIGSKTLLPGFEDALVGIKKGESKTFTLTLPEKFQAEALRNKPATFHVTAQRVEEITLPELTDAFAKEKLNAESADAFKKMVTDSIRAQEEEFVRMDRERTLMDAIRTATTVDLADELLEEEVRGMIQEWSDQLAQQGKTIMEVLEQQKKTPEQVEAEMKEQANDRWRLRLGIGKLIEHHKIELSPEELDAAFTGFQSRLSPEEQTKAADEWQKRGNLYEEIRWRTMVDKLMNLLLA